MASSDLPTAPSTPARKVVAIATDATPRAAGGRGDLTSPSLGPPTTPSGKRYGVEDFLFGAVLGEGAYGKVVHVRLRQPKRSPVSATDSTSSAPHHSDYAMKIMDKAFIKKERKVRSDGGRGGGGMMRFQLPFTWCLLARLQLWHVCVCKSPGCLRWRIVRPPGRATPLHTHPHTQSALAHRVLTRPLAHPTPCRRWCITRPPGRATPLHAHPHTQSALARHTPTRPRHTLACATTHPVGVGASCVHQAAPRPCRRTPTPSLRWRIVR
jgi:hypothetical protein